MKFYKKTGGAAPQGEYGCPASNDNIHYPCVQETFHESFVGIA